MENSDAFVSLMNLDPEKLPKDERCYYIAQKLGEREELHGFTQEEKAWIVRMLEEYPEAVAN